MLKNTSSGRRKVSQKIQNPDKTIPNWLLYLGVILLLSLGALKIAWGLIPIYR